MKPVRTLIVSAVFVVIAVGVAVWLYPHMPMRIPTHWDINGQPNGYSSRFWGAAMWPLLIFGLAALTVVLPRISPKGFGMESFAGVFGLMMLVVQGVVLVHGIAAMLAGAGHAVPMTIIVHLSLGVLLMVLGNYMGKLRRNFFAGIRTPWTLASEAVWERTHRLASWLFVLAGVVLVVAAPFHAMRLPLGVVLSACLIPVAYSYFIYRRLEGRHSSEGDPS